MIARVHIERRAPAAQPAFVEDVTLERLQAVNVVVVAWDRKTCGAVVVAQPCCTLAEPEHSGGANVRRFMDGIAMMLKPFVEESIYRSHRCHYEHR